MWTGWCNVSEPRMWSVLACVKLDRIDHQWRSRRMPSWQNLLSLQNMVCLHVSVNVCADTGWHGKESWIYCCRLFSGMIQQTLGFWAEGNQFFPVSWSYLERESSSAHFVFWPWLALLCMEQNLLGNSLGSWQSVAHKIWSGCMSL